MKRVFSSTAIAAALLGSAFAGVAHAEVTLDKGITVNGQGSSFVSNFIEQCKADVKNAFGINIGYQPTGSGAGRSNFISGASDFGGSDVPFTPAEMSQLKDKKFVYLPITIGGIAVIYRLADVTDLKLSGPTLAKIFSGEVQKWNAEPIAKDNPGVSLPDSIIKVVVRSDSSGTSSVFSDYLSTAGKGSWSKGVTSTFPVPSGNGIAQRGSDGTSNYVAGSQGDGAITYAEVSFATERKLSIAKVINASGNATLPGAAAVTEAMSSAAVNDDGTLLLNFNAPGAKAYPISTTSYVIAPVTLDPAKADVLRTFLTYGLGACQSKAEKLGYAPLPPALAELGAKTIEKITGTGPVPTVPAATAGSGATTAPASTPQSTGNTTATTKATATSKATATTKATATRKATATTKAKSKTKTTKKPSATGH